MIYYIRINTSDFTFIHSYAFGPMNSYVEPGLAYGDIIAWEDTSTWVCKTYSSSVPKCFSMLHNDWGHMNVYTTGTLIYFFDTPNGY